MIKISLNKNLVYKLVRLELYIHIIDETVIYEVCSKISWCDRHINYVSWLS